MDGGKQEFGRFELAGLQDTIAEGIGGVVVKAQVVQGNQDQPMSGLFKGDHAGSQRIMDALGEIGAAGITVV